jgi:pyruvate dehydrogenase E2 component (dihydrolipoamide acetyltransferase)
MPYPITIPRLGWSMEEGVFSEWLKAPGDFVRAGDMIFVLEGEKAANEIESFDSGTLCIPADAPRPGTTVKVGETIGFLLLEGEQAPTSVRGPGSNASTTHTPSPGRSPDSANVPARPSVSAVSAMASAPRVAGPAARRLARALGIDLNTVSTPDPTGRVLREDVQRAAQQRADQRSSGIDARQAVATPRAKRRARELGIDWTRLVGTGRAGRIREQDVLATHPDYRRPTAESPLPLAPGRFVPAFKLRQVIAQRMMAGVHEAAPVTLTTKIDAGVLVAYRERLKADATDDVVPSYNDILIQCVAHTLRELPELNACWSRNGVHYYDAVHIATAVDTPDGLLAPVVRDADRLTLREITEQTRQLIALARSGRLSGNQLAGSTFTVSNLGSFGIDAFTPILNLPQAGILGIGRIVDEPVVRNGQLAVGKTMTLSLTFDHRVIDGAPAARWLQRLGERVQAVDRLDADGQ